jgi:phospholipid N-methyltransferase
MQTYQIRVNDEIITKFLWLLEYFKKDIEVIKIEPNHNFIKTMEQSKKDIEQGNIKAFDFSSFEKELD